MTLAEVAFDAISVASEGYRVAVQAPTKTLAAIFNAMAAELEGVPGVKLYRAHGRIHVLLPAMHPVRFVATLDGLRGLEVDVLFTVEPQSIYAAPSTNGSAHPDPIRGLS